MYTLDDVHKYVYKRRPAGVIVDTNILLLLLIGHYDVAYIKDCSLFTNNGKNYTIEDFELLKRIIKCFDKLIITPQIIAEISSISITKKCVPGNRAYTYLQTVVNILKDAEEHHQQAKCLWGMKLEVLSRFGFTDMTLYELSRKTEIPVLTDEFNLYHYLVNNSVPAIKFEYIKNSQEGLPLT